MELLAGIILVFLFWIIRKAYNSFRYTNSFGVDADKVYKKYINDRSFLKDLIQVIKDEGGIDEFIRKTQKLVPDKDVDDYIYIYYKGGIKNPEFQKRVTGKTAPIIVYKLIAMPSFKKYFRAYRMKKAWEKSVADAVHGIVSAENFREEFRKMLKNAGEDQSLADKMPRREMATEEKHRFFGL